jgi:hypothetical protein
MVSRPLTQALLHLYDYPDPRRPGRIIPGYDCAHALRTARMCAGVALRLGHKLELVRQYQIACLLHDVSRAGLDRRLFGKIWSWARQQGIPTRPREWRSIHPATPYGRETEAFLARHGDDMQKAGIVRKLDGWVREQVEMRLGHARRLKRQLRLLRPRLTRLGVAWTGWMTLVVLYYYYPEKMAGAPAWVRQFGEILVACEQFEAYNNRRRGRDYYTRNTEKLEEAFAYLEKLQAEGILSAPVIQAVRSLAGEGAFDRLLAQARGAPLSLRERRYLKSLRVGAA